VERVGPIALQELLGRGGMGAVHRAVDTRTGQACVVKLVHVLCEDRRQALRPEVEPLRARVEARARAQGR
jgi:hypothetical protein